MAGIKDAGSPAKTVKVPEFKKTFAEIATDGEERKRNPTKEDLEGLEIPDEKLDKVLKEESPQDDKLKESVRKEKAKAREERETKIADESAKRAVEGIKKELEELKPKKEEKKEEPKPRTPKWTEEKRNPKDYDEIFNEAKEAAKAEALEEFNRQLSEREVQAKRATDEENAAKQKQADEQKSREEVINKKINRDLEDLFSTGKLPKIKDENDPNDEGVLAKKELLRTAKEVNDKLIAEGKTDQLYFSLKEVYLDHYKAPSKQPAGASAPVMGNASPAVEQESVTSYRDLHNKSFAQLAMDAAKRVVGR